MLLTSCFKQHNKAPSKGANLQSERIYGESREAPPRQLQVTWPDDESGEIQKRALAIQEKLYPTADSLSKWSWRADYLAAGQVDWSSLHKAIKITTFAILFKKQLICTRL